MCALENGERAQTPFSSSVTALCKPIDASVKWVLVRVAEKLTQEGVRVRSFCGFREGRLPVTEGSSLFSAEGAFSLLWVAPSAYRLIEFGVRIRPKDVRFSNAFQVLDGVSPPPPPAPLRALLGLPAKQPLLVQAAGSVGARPGILLHLDR